MGLDGLPGLEAALGRDVIPRDPQAATRQAADLVVIGGGVYGIALTLEAARRGLRPVLIERDDFGSRTSWNSLRIVHGGLRYLQNLDLRRYRESVAERRWWLATFPDLVAPLPCLMPLYGRGLRRRSVLQVALGVDALLSWNRNRGVSTQRRLPAGRVMAARETLEKCPWLDSAGLAGAALWFDALMLEPQRLLMEMLHWACAEGASALNYVEAVEPLLDGAAIAGVRAVDRSSGDVLAIRSPVVVNCAGPWCRELARRLDRDLPDLFSPSLALNLLLDRRPPADCALALLPPGPNRSSYFLVPFADRLLVGTFHAECTGPPADSDPDEKVVDRFLAELALVAPELAIRREEIARVLWGYLPARRTGSTALATREAVLHHGESDGPRGLFSVSGVKFTTARRVAEKTLRRIRSWQGLTLPPASRRRSRSNAALMSWPEFERLRLQDSEAAGGYLRRVAARESVVHPEDLVLRRHDWGLDSRRLERILETVTGLLS